MYLKLKFFIDRTYSLDISDFKLFRQTVQKRWKVWLSLLFPAQELLHPQQDLLMVKKPAKHDCWVWEWKVCCWNPGRVKQIQKLCAIVYVPVLSSRCWVLSQSSPCVFLAKFRMWLSETLCSDHSIVFSVFAGLSMPNASEGFRRRIIRNWHWDELSRLSVHAYVCVRMTMCMRARVLPY